MNKFELKDPDRLRAVRNAAAKRVGVYMIQGDRVTDAQIAARLGVTPDRAQKRRKEAAKLDGPITWAKLGLTVAALLAATVMAGCERIPDDGTGDDNLLVYRDALTGCEYLTRYGGGLTARMDASGRHICRPTQPQERQP